MRKKYLLHLLFVLMVIVAFAFIMNSCGNNNDPVKPPVNGTDPKITTINPQSAYIGQVIIINGENFDTTKTSNSVTINSVQVADSNLIHWESGKITMYVPAGATSGSVVVTAKGKASNAYDLIISGNPDNTAPHIDYLSQDIAQIRQVIGINGKNFGSSQGYVEFNGVKATTFASWTNSLVEVTVPDNASTGNVVVYTSNGVATNGVWFKLQVIVPIVETIAINTGSFVMGSNTEDFDGFGCEKPEHAVQISRPFYLGKFEITQKQFKKVMSGSNPSRVQNDDNPVETLSWLRAVQFCNTLSKMEQLDTCYIVTITPTTTTVTCNFDANGWRLPTEAEWEYACRAGKSTKYAGTGSINQMGWTNENSNNNPHIIGQKTPNDWGLFDMHGNVREWCWDYYECDYYKTRPNPDVNPTGPTISDTYERINRGGSYAFSADEATSAYRVGLNQTQGSYDLGFRIARTKK